MQKSIELLRKNDELKTIEEELDIYLEIPHLAYAEVKKKDGGKALLFTNAVDKKSGKKFKENILMNLLVHINVVSCYLADQSSLSRMR